MEFLSYKSVILLEHGKRIGTILQIKKDHKGIFIYFIIEEKYEYLLNDYNYLSIGFQILEYVYKNNHRIINNFILKEVSIVKKPAQNNTTFKLISLI